MAESSIKKIVVFGPGPVFKGGISNFTSALCNALAIQPGIEVHLVSWTQQYPAIIPRQFTDTKSADRILSPVVHVHYVTNYNNPLSWTKTIEVIEALQPDKVIVQWAIALQGLPIGYIFNRLKKKLKCEILFDVHNLIQKENSAFDRMLTRYALKAAHHYIMHGPSTIEEFKRFFPELKIPVSKDGSRAESPTILHLFHPIYDIFKPLPNFDAEAEKRKLGLRKHVFLFFGFIRKYKGLHHTIEAFAELAKKRDDVSLLIVGESFWDETAQVSLGKKFKKSIFGLLKKLFIKSRDQEKDYKPLALISELGIQNKTVIVNEFVPNEEVHRYFQVCDAVVNFYEYATPSGVESIAYQFLKPVLTTPVGHFKETIQDGQNGYVSPSFAIADLCKTLEKAIEEPVSESNLLQFKQKLSWQNYVKAILKSA